MKTCTKCNKEQNYSEFRKNRNSCRECDREYNRQYHQDNAEQISQRKSDYLKENYALIAPKIKGGQQSQKRFIQSIKLTAGCMDCGYNSHPEALDFDHRPEEIKAFSIGGSFHSLDSLIEEIMKCDVVCANCHRIRTANRRVGK